MRPGTSKRFRNLGPAGLLQPQFPTVSVCLLQMLSTQLVFNPVSSGDPLAQLQGNHQMHGNGQYIFHPTPTAFAAPHAPCPSAPDLAAFPPQAPRTTAVSCWVICNSFQTGSSASSLAPRPPSLPLHPRIQSDPLQGPKEIMHYPPSIFKWFLKNLNGNPDVYHEPT